MAYQALYRKYRPNNFDDVVGQDVVVKTLKNSLISGKTSHAYMFSGPRGVGKTSIAKILAKSINCLNLENGNACNHCKNCQSINSNETTDIIEIDAASNNGVDEIREIRNNITLVPSELKYKVYIIDEVHMLSIGAFNALLKTLEEPPSHVIFILATTDPHKVPITIISRCQCFEFKRILTSEIVSKLQAICEKENISIDLDVLNKVAKISEGGMRDSLGLLDKISSYCETHITIEEFNKIIGIVSDEIVDKFIFEVHQKNILQVINYIEDIYSSGKDFVIFSQDLIDFLRNLMLDFYLNAKESYSIEFILRFISTLDKMLIDLKNSNNIRIAFETSILSFINSEMGKNDIKQTFAENKIISREIISNKSFGKEMAEKNLLNLDEDKLNVAAFEGKSSNSELNISSSQNESIRFVIVNNTFATAQKNFLVELKKQWSKFNDFVLDKSYGAAACYLVDSQLRAVGKQEFIITCSYESVLDRGLSLIPVMEELVEKVFHSIYKIAVLTEQEWNVERSKFINLKNKGEKYVYKKLDDSLVDMNSQLLKDDTNPLTENNDLVQQAISIFGEDIVKVNLN